MADYTGSFGFTDSSTTPLVLNVPNLSYAKDFAVTVEKAGETILTNITSPVDQPERIRHALEVVNNIYTGTGIDPSLFAVTKRGFSLVVGNDLIYRVSGASTSGAPWAFDLPLHYHTVVKAASSPYLPTSVIYEGLLRHFGSFQNGDNSSAFLEQLIRGALTPSGM